MQEICLSLPRPVDDVDVVLIKSPKSPTPREVHFMNIYSALQWLCTNNILYKSVTVDNSFRIGSIQSPQTDTVNETFPTAALYPEDFVVPFKKQRKCCPITNLPMIKSEPINIFQHPTLEEMTFPTLYPYGCKGLRASPSIPSILKYLQTRILNKDTRWRSNIQYLFWATNIYEQHNLQDQISIVLRLKTSPAAVTVKQISQTCLPKALTEDYAFMKNIRGTTGYWRNQLSNLFAKIRTIGPPTFFLSLSANDMHWPEVYMCIDTSLSYEDAFKLPASDKCKLLQKNPVLAAIHFDIRWKAFLKHILLGKDEPLGQITDHFARVEFQNRGSPHVHVFLWVASAPNMETQSGRDSAPAFIDKYICAKLPCVQSDKELHQLVSSLQVHKHTQTCLRGRSHTCRFDFPQPVSKVTRHKIYMDTGSPARFYVLSRNIQDIWVNPYNPTLLQAWKANMDIQVVGNKYAAAMYICTYICKQEPKALRNAISLCMSQLPPHATARKKLSKLGNVILTHRILSSQEATFRLCGLQLVYSSRETVYVNCRQQEKRYRLLKSAKTLSSMNENSTNIFQDNTATHYMNRPNCDLFSNMSLASFACKYVVFQPKDTNKLHSEKALPRFRLNNSTKWIRQRSKPACLRTNQLSLLKDETEYYFGLLYLFLPWRTECELLIPWANTQATFQCQYNNMDMDTAQYMNMAENITKAIQQLRATLQDDLEQIQCSFAPNTMHLQQVEAMDTTQQNPDNIFMYDTLNAAASTTDDKVSTNEDFSSDFIKTLACYTMTDTQYKASLSLLTECQRTVVQIIDKQLHKVDQPPIHMFVTGGAGTGKSFLIRLLREQILRSNNTLVPNVLVAAPTGVAAHNIHGLTLHKLLSLPVQHMANATYLPISAYNLQKLRNTFENVTFLIVDEVSMISSNTLEHIHRRLTEIKDTAAISDCYFGNVNIIVFGDLYQLRPVFGSMIYTTQQPFNLWTQLFKLKELQQNKRQEGDVIFASLLNRVRIGTQTQDDIHVLKTRIITTDSTALQSFLHIFPTKAQCKTHNASQLQVLKNHGQTVYVINAHDSPDIKITADETKCGGLHHQLCLAIGARVMLLRNINTASGLVNGAQGTVSGFEWRTGIPEKEGELPCAVDIQFDNTNIGNIAGISTHGKVSIVPVHVQFFSSNTSITRCQLPLTLSWATTVHKIQGCTLQTAVVDLGNKIFASGMAYVALSRLQTLHGLHLTALNPKGIMTCQAIHDEMFRLRSLGDYTQ